MKVADGIVQSAVGNFHWNQVSVILEQLICIVGLGHHHLQNIRNHFHYRYAYPKPKFWSTLISFIRESRVPTSWRTTEPLFVAARIRRNRATFATVKSFNLWRRWWWCCWNWISSPFDGLEYQTILLWFQKSKTRNDSLYFQRYFRFFIGHFTGHYVNSITDKKLQRLLSSLLEKVSWFHGSKPFGCGRKYQNIKLADSCTESDSCDVIVGLYIFNPTIQDAGYYKMSIAELGLESSLHLLEVETGKNLSYRNFRAIFRFKISFSVTLTVIKFFDFRRDRIHQKR